jgi:Yip1 domain
MSRGLAARIAGVVFSPRATYGDVAARPRWFGVLFLIILCGSAGVYTLLSTQVGQNALLDQQVRQAEAFGRPMTDAQYEQLERLAPYGKYFGVGFQVVVLPLAAVILAALAFVGFNVIMGGDASFKQVFAIVVHSGVVLTLVQTLGLPLAYLRESLSGTTNLAIFAPFLDENSFGARLLGAVDLVFIWWIVSLAIGLGVLYRKRTGPIATTLIVIYVAIGVVIAAVKSAVS